MQGKAMNSWYNNKNQWKTRKETQWIAMQSNEKIMKRMQSKNKQGTPDKSYEK